MAAPDVERGPGSAGLEARPGDEGAEAPLPFTVRRAVPKLGRNDPCHCGSGRKYKRCHLDSDRERLADPSPYAGLTMEEAKREPARHGDPAIFLEMSRAELDAVDRSALSPELLRGLLSAYQEQGELVPAAAVLALLAERLGTEEAVAAERDSLVYQALARQDRKLARAEEARRAGPPTFESQLNKLSLDLLHRPPEKLVRLDSYLRQLVDDPHDLTELSDAVSLAGLPGLALAIARAAVTLGGRSETREALADLLSTMREQIGLPPDDPAARLLGAGVRPQHARRSDQAMAELTARLREREAAIQKVRSERDRLAGELEKRSLLPPPATAPEASRSDEEARRLKRKVEELQAELRDKQRQREELSQKLRQAHEGEASLRSRRAGEAQSPTVDDDDGEEVPEDAAIQPLRFAPAFYETAADLGDGRVALRAQELAVRFAALDPATWKQAKKMQDLANVFTLRVGIHHRLFIVRAGGTVEARELCTREGFDRMLKLRYRR